MRIYSRIMGIPLDVASDSKEFRTSLSKYSDRDIIFIDTTGRNPRDRTHIEQLMTLYEVDTPIETHLLMSAASDDEFMTESYRNYGTLPIDCIAFTKVDEATRLGSIYNLSVVSEKPVGYITTGQRVPQDIEFPDSSRLAAMIMGNGVDR
jgi:flagellar biosynthesis protein FlhF